MNEISGAPDRHLTGVWQLCMPVGVLLVAVAVFSGVAAIVETKLSLAINAAILLTLGCLDLVVGSKAKAGAAGR
jgi:hypothetical protein